MFRIVDEDGNNVLDIMELAVFKYALFESKKDSGYDQSILFKKANAFFDWYINYSDTARKGKAYSQKQIAEIIFKDALKSEAEMKEFLLKSFLISSDYVKHLKSSITESNIKRYDHTLGNLITDLEWLISQYEVHIKKTVPSVKIESWRRKNLSPTDIYGAAKQMFFIEELENLDQLYLRDLKPVVMFQIRQLLEIYGKNILGIVDITNKDGMPVKKFTQVSWEFIAEEVKRPNPRISFPFDIQTILNINSWANSFVHTTYLYNDYIQFYALNAIKVLFMSTEKAIKTYDGQNQKKFLLADIKIRDYNALKVDFELFLTSRMSDVRVEWDHMKNVGAHITSL